MITTNPLTQQSDQEEKIRETLAQHLGRRLTEEDLETIQFFMNGLQHDQQKSSTLADK